MYSRTLIKVRKKRYWFSDLAAMNGIQCHNCGARLSPALHENSRSGVYGGKCGNCHAVVKFKMENLPTDSVSFSINGKSYTVDSTTANPYTTVLDFIRNTANLTGTKYMCYEGGCGACVVTVTSTDPATGEKVVRPVNSCLAPVLKCHGWEITTVEGLGSAASGYHPLQSTLAAKNGTQCGVCSPGFVMSAHSLIAKGGSVSAQDMEDQLEGNTCRCTGYRPILEAFKTFTTDAKKACHDIEDMRGKVCPNTGTKCTGRCGGHNLEHHRNGTNIRGGLRDRQNSSLGNTRSGFLMLQGMNWYRPANLTELFSVFTSLGTSTYRLVAGNTGSGIYKSDGPYDNMIDVNQVTELFQRSVSPLAVGGAMTIQQVIEYIQSADKLIYPYLDEVIKHLKRVAGASIRNAATLGGNLMLKHMHQEFVSDIFTVLEGIGASLNIADQANSVKSYTPLDFLALDMQKRVIVSISFPQIASTYKARTFKITPVGANSHAYINATFLMQVDGLFTVLSKPNLVFGGISDTFVHATQTENFLVGKLLTDSTVLQTALSTLASEINPTPSPLDADPQYRLSVAQGLLYKFVLGIVNIASDRMKSGATDLVRPTTSATQTFIYDETKAPLYEPIPLIEGKVQCSGEAKYIMDTPATAGQLTAAVLTSTVGSATLGSIDASAALAVSGVRGFFDAKDIPGRNAFAAKGDSGSFVDDEEVFASSKISYYGQPLGVIVADSWGAAQEALALVKVTYLNVQQPVITIQEAMKDPNRIQKASLVDRLRGNPKVVHIPQNKSIKKTGATTDISGEFEMGYQYHFHLETHITICEPIEDGLVVHCSTQNIDGTHNTIAQVLNMPRNKINISVRRVGGGYGAKQSRSLLPAAICAVAAQKLNMAVRLQLSLEENIQMVGGRSPVYVKYQASVDELGKIQTMAVDLYSDVGNSYNENSAGFAGFTFTLVYSPANWAIQTFGVRTDLPCNVYCRGPGLTEGIAVIEAIMDHAAKATGRDPLEFRILNLKTYKRIDKPGDPLVDVVNQLRASSNYDERSLQVKAFNQANRWKKQGIAMYPSVFPLTFGTNVTNCTVSIFHSGGAVAVSHGGIEMGQGINTKVAQTVAYGLGLDISMVQIKPTDAAISPNNSLSGGSLTSEFSCYSAMKCCEILTARMQPVKDQMGGNPTWADLVEECYRQNIDLCAHYYASPLDKLLGYYIYVAVVTQVEVDILTGERQVLRVDILEDAGQSVSPLIDIGQIEGAFVMGMGLWLTERMVYDPTSGQRLITNTWDYKPPTVKDIPVDFRVGLVADAYNPHGVLGTKATAEPPLLLSFSVILALRQALDSARADAGIADYYLLNGPATVDKCQLVAGVKADQMVFA